MHPSKSASAFVAPDHDHSVCVSRALADAEAHCLANGLQLTATRRQVLEIICQGHEPAKAYDILDQLSRAGRRAAPPTVYRALEFLLDARLVHRIDSLNAYVACIHPARQHSAQLLVCSNCDQVAEIDDPQIHAVLDRGASRHGFQVDSQTVEIHGRCPRCRAARGADHDGA
ncbi:MAG: Fur family transcriptional regulator [Gammaproteobacteria bacterium]